ncbi:MAG: hypothetical protein IPH33_12750 [Bacteroidetes bacterium]|nr:hypothetical protein [Bacteroidota bacterium]
MTAKFIKIILMSVLTNLLSMVSTFAQSDDFVIKQSSNFRMYYDEEHKVVNGPEANYIFYADIQTDKNGDVIGYVNITHKSGVKFFSRKVA